MAAHQAPPYLGFSRQEHWSGLPFPSPMHESEKWKWSRSPVSDPQRHHGLQPTRLLHPWDFPGKSTGVGCHCFLLLYLEKNLKIVIGLKKIIINIPGLFPSPLFVVNAIYSWWINFIMHVLCFDLLLFCLKYTLGWQVWQLPVSGEPSVRWSAVCVFFRSSTEEFSGATMCWIYTYCTPYYQIQT